MKKLLCLLLAVFFCVHMLPAAFASEQEEYLWDDTYTETNGLKVGTYELTLAPDAVYTLFYFRPGEIGIYTLTVSEGATIGYWGAGSFYYKNPNSTANTLVREIKAASNANVIGICSDSPTVTLTIEKTGESQGNLEYEYIDYVNVHSPNERYVYKGNRAISVDISQPHTAVLGRDGFYHLESSDGPVLYVDLITDGFNLPNAYTGYGALAMKGSFEGKHYNFKQAMFAYSQVLDADGRYPMSEDLYKFIRAYGKNQFWFDQEKSPFAAVQTGGFHAESVWMVMCVYVPGMNTPVIPTEPPTIPTEPPTVPTEPPTIPTEPPTIPTEPPTIPTEPPTIPTEPPTVPTEPPTVPTEPPTVPTEPPTVPTEPPTIPTEPPTIPTEPPTVPTEPPTVPTEPPTVPTEPPTIPTEPPTVPTEPPTIPTESPTIPTEPPTIPTEPSKPDDDEVAQALNGCYALKAGDENTVGLIDFRPAYAGALQGTMILDLNVYVSGEYAYSYHSGSVIICYPGGSATPMKLDVQDLDKLVLTVNPKLGQVYSLVSVGEDEKLWELALGMNSVSATVANGFCPPISVFFTAPKDGIFRITGSGGVEAFEWDGVIPLDGKGYIVELSRGQTYFFKLVSTDSGDGEKNLLVSITEKPEDPVIPEPTEPPTIPTEPPTVPTEPPTIPTEPPTVPTEPPTEPPTIPTEPPTIPTEPPTIPTEPPTIPTEPPTIPTKPSTAASIPTDAIQPTAASVPPASTAPITAAKPGIAPDVLILSGLGVLFLALAGAALIILKRRH